MTLKQIRKGIINQYEIKNGNWLVRISEDTESQGKGITAITYTNNGETPRQSKSFKTLKGAERFAQTWLANA